MLRKIGTALGLADDSGRDDAGKAAEALASEVSADMREAMDALIARHGLTGRAAADVEAR